MRRTRTTTLAALSTLLLAGSVLAQPGMPIDRPGAGGPRAFAPAKRLTHPNLEVMEGWIGTWRIEATWQWGSTLKARNVFRPGMNGKYVEQSTIVSDDGADAYERYRTTWAWDAQEHQIVAYGFDNRGDAMMLPIKVDQSDPKHPVLETVWDDGETEIRQRVSLTGADEYRWLVETRPVAGDASQPRVWTTIMDGTWVRVKAEEEPERPARPGPPGIPPRSPREPRDPSSPPGQPPRDPSPVPNVPPGLPDPTPPQRGPGASWGSFPGDAR